MTWVLDGKPLRSILVSRLRYLGDVVMSTVMLEVLRAGDPDLELGFLCEQGHAAALENHPSLNRLHRLRSQRVGADATARLNRSLAADSSRAAEPAASSAALGTLAMVRELRRARYDLAVDLFNPRSAWLLKLAGIPLRIGGSRGFRRRLFSHTVLRKEVAASHPGFNELAPGGLGEHLSRLEPLVHQPSGLGFVSWLARCYQPGQLRPRLGSSPLGGQAKDAMRSLVWTLPALFFILAPAATWRSKEWPLSRWRELVRALVKQNRSSVLVLTPPSAGSPWPDLALEIPAGTGGVLPALELDQVLSLLGRAALLIAVDGGIMHAGVGLGIPTVGIFGPTRPDIWFPYERTGPFRVLFTGPPCHPCNLHDCPEFVCLPDLETSAVLQGVREVLERNSEPDAPADGSGVNDSI